MGDKRLDSEGRRVWAWPRNPEYLVREDGVIFGPSGQVATFLRNGYLSVSWRGGTESVHVVVCETFHGPKPAPTMQVAHDDGDKRNNAATNLAWKTVRENAADKKRHGTQPLGSQVVWSKLTEEDVRGIRVKKQEGRSLASLGREYGVAYQTIQSALSGRSWSHVR